MFLTDLETIQMFLLNQLAKDIISVTLSILTSAAPLSVVLSLFSEEKRGRSEGQD